MEESNWWLQYVSPPPFPSWSYQLNVFSSLSELMLDLLTISLVAGIPTSLKNIPQKYNIIIRLWTNCFYRLLKNLWHSSPISKIAWNIARVDSRPLATLPNIPTHICTTSSLTTAAVTNRLCSFHHMEYACCKVCSCLRVEHAVEGVHQDVQCAAVARWSWRVCATEHILRSSLSEGRAARVALARMEVHPSSLLSSLPSSPYCCVHMAPTPQTTVAVPLSQFPLLPRSSNRLWWPCWASTPRSTAWPLMSSA